jgi:hypothetical protein
MEQRSLKTLVYRTENGCIINDVNARTIHVEFGNVFLRFDFEGLQRFKQSIDGVKLDIFEQANESKPYNRKVFVAFERKSVTLAFHPDEIEELRDLLNGAHDILLQKHLAYEALNYSKN